MGIEGIENLKPLPKEKKMETYIFTVVVMGDDVQDASERFRERLIDWTKPGTRSSLLAENEGVSVHVTESVRVSPND